MNIFLEFDDIDISKYNDVDWLDTNKLNAIVHPFTVRYMDLVLISDGLYPVRTITLELGYTYAGWEYDGTNARDIPVDTSIDVITMQDEDT